MKSILEKFFEIEANRTSIQGEVIAGITTFITMAYIIFVNPQMMAQSGMDHGAIFVGTCLAASLACLFMGIYSNWPVGLAPGMGLNAFFTYTVVGEMGYSWEIALGAVFIAGILFFLMSVTPLRRWMLDSIPLNLRIAMGSGVGLFIGFIGLKNGGIIVANGATFLSLGDFTEPSTMLAGLGFLLISILAIRNIHGAIIIGILSITLISALFI
jgi:Permeases